MNPLLVILLLLLLISGTGLIIFILLHSGKGTGVSDMYANQGTSIVEKNLDRITIVLAIVFFIVIVALMFVYPQGTIQY